MINFVMIGKQSTFEKEIKIQPVALPVYHWHSPTQAEEVDFLCEDWSSGACWHHHLAAQIWPIEWELWSHLTFRQCMPVDFEDLIKPIPQRGISRQIMF